MDPFESLPDEMIEKICKGMNASTLKSLMQSKDRFIQICQPIYEQQLRLEQEEARQRQREDIARKEINPYVFRKDIAQYLSDEDLANLRQTSLGGLFGNPRRY